MVQINPQTVTSLSRLLLNLGIDSATRHRLLLVWTVDLSGLLGGHVHLPPGHLLLS